LERRISEGLMMKDFGESWKKQKRFHVTKGRKGGSGQRGGQKIGKKKPQYDP